MCGERLWDDFIEQRPGAARELEAYLNRPRECPNSSTNVNTSASMDGSTIPTGRTGPILTPLSSKTMASQSISDTPPQVPVPLAPSNPFAAELRPLIDVLYLLAYANEGKYTPMVTHLDVTNDKIHSDKDLALTLKHYYNGLNNKFLSFCKLTSLTSIKFVQVSASITVSITFL